MHLAKTCAKLGRGLAKTLVILSFLPLFESCNAHISNRLTEEKVKSVVALRNIKPAKCRIEPDGLRVTYIYPKFGKEITFEMDLPEGISLASPLLIACRKYRTILVTSDYLAITIGRELVDRGRESLGSFEDGLFVLANSVIAPLQPIGKITNAIIIGSELNLTNSLGVTYTIDIDRPSKPAHKD